jgi:acyl-coenzyme A thioesterase PaaI-like protein
MSKTVRDKQPNSRHCFVCGLENDFGLKARFFEVEGDEVVAVFEPGDAHQGYPGRLHGGLATAILDEAIGRAIMIHDRSYWGVTAEMTVRFRAPVPLNARLKAVGRIHRQAGRLFEGTGEIVLDDGTVAVSATGKYVKLPLDSITEAGEDFVEDAWFVERSASDPEAL